MQNFNEWVKDESVFDMFRSQQSLDLRQLSPEEQNLYKKIQSNPQLKQDLDTRVSVKKEPLRDAIRSIMSYGNLSSFQNYMQRKNPTGAYPQQQHTGDLRHGNLVGKDLTSRIYNPAA